MDNLEPYQPRNICRYLDELAAWCGREGSELPFTLGFDHLWKKTGEHPLPSGVLLIQRKYRAERSLFCFDTGHDDYTMHFVVHSRIPVSVFLSGNHLLFQKEANVILTSTQMLPGHLMSVQMGETYLQSYQFTTSNPANLQEQLSSIKKDLESVLKNRSERSGQLPLFGMGSHSFA